MIIAQISDTHLTLDTPEAERRIREFALTIADINALDPPPDAIVHTGDIVHNGRRDEYAQAAALLAKAHAPVYVLPGNKDDRANLRAAFSGRDYLTPDSEFIDYVVEDFPARLIALDTVRSGANRGDFRAEQAQRLVEWTDAEPDRPIAVFTHHPPFEVTVGPVRFHFETTQSMALLQQALQRRERIVAVFSGHVHRAAAGRVGTIPASVVPCIATSLRKGEYPSRMQTRPVYHLHRFDPAWGFVTESRAVGMQGSAAGEQNNAPIPAASLAHS